MDLIVATDKSGKQVLTTQFEAKAMGYSYSGSAGGGSLSANNPPQNDSKNSLGVSSDELV